MTVYFRSVLYTNSGERALARTCPRCGGTGRYGPTVVFQGICFKCSGARVVRLPQSKQDAILRSLDRHAAALGGRKIPRAKAAPKAAAVEVR